MKKLLLISLLFILFFLPGADMRINTVNHTMGNFPAHLQFFARDRTNNDSARITVSGYISDAGYDSVQCKIYKTGSVIRTLSYNLTYGGGTANFSFLPAIHADTFEYKITLTAFDAGSGTVIESADSLIAGDVFLMAGQSNSHYPNDTGAFTRHTIRSAGTNGYLGAGTNNYPAGDTTWGLARATSDGASGNSPTCGTYMIGVTMMAVADQLVRTYGIPICVINGGVGGSSLGYNLAFSPRDSLGYAYGITNYRLKKAHLADKVRAIFWNQGENDCQNPSDVSNYPTYFKGSLYDYWMIDFPNVEKVYVFQLNVITNTSGSGYPYCEDIREIQRRLPLTCSKVKVIAQAGVLGYDGLHYFKRGYDSVAALTVPIVARDMYGRTDTVAITPPNLVKWYYNPSHTKIYLKFDQGHLRYPADTNGGKKLMSYIYASNTSTYIKDTIGATSTFTIGDSIIGFNLASPIYKKKLSLYPNSFYNDSSTGYVGPFLRNQRGVNALTFYNVDSSAMADTAVTALDSAGMGFVQVTVKLRNAADNTDLHGVVTYTGLTELPFGTTQKTMYIWPGYYSFHCTYAGSEMTIAQDVSIDPVVVFQTASVTIKCMDKSGFKDVHAMAMYWDRSRWVKVGNTQTSVELFPGSYIFSVSASTFYQSKIFNVSNNSIVKFQQ